MTLFIIMVHMLANSTSTILGVHIVVVWDIFADYPEDSWYGKMMEYARRRQHWQGWQRTA
jgi:hypothetical protein